jgi:hypothetical protein
VWSSFTLNSKMPGAFGNFGQSIGDRIDKLITQGLIRQVGTVATAPEGMRVVKIDDLESEFAPWFKKWWVWAIAGTVVVGGVGFFYFRRRR